MLADEVCMGVTHLPYRKLSVGNTLGFILSEAGEFRAERGSPRDFWLLLVHCRGAKAKAGRPGIDGSNSPDQKRRKRHTVHFR